VPLYRTVLVCGNNRYAKEVATPEGDRPADILLIGWDKGTDVCVDLTVTSPLSFDSYPLNLDRARRHLNNAEEDKRAKQLHQCEAVSRGHHPAAYSPWGGQGITAKHYFLKS